ncbi:hypothetical protein BD410DRAFT_788775 [Rickenella mellea]|uniref:RING-type domain-containing protein n=1 Tax=Rickenella mellea TaxID=50990 RepID=A0A4Y7Q364_9AGAM|nr:hypothetical protein BD410DRAFT_788775 [Rickenella mellea]
MGQANSSTNAHTSNNTTHATQGDHPQTSGSATNDDAGPNLHLRPGTGASRRSRTQSVRNSILNLMRHDSDSIQNDPHDERPSGSRSEKKLWRRSRRWSKTPVQSAVETATTVSPILKDDQISQQEQGLQPREQGDASTAPKQETTKQATELSEDAEEPQSTPALPVRSSPSPSPPESDTNSPSELPSSPTTSTTSASLIVPATRTVERPVELATIDLQGTTGNVVDSYDAARPNATPTSPSTVQDNLSPQDGPRPSPQPQEQPHQGTFPPPGTLVVVQGVVHTNDPPRTTAPSATQNASSVNPQNMGSRNSPLNSDSVAASSSGIGGNLFSRHRSRDPTPGQRNSLLSSLLRRGDTSPSNPSGAGSPLGRRSGSSSSLSLPQPNIGDVGVEGDDHSGNPTVTSIPSSNPPNAEHGNAQQDSSRRHGQLSDSSIEVLGTLLSVATAATAASLVTGSADAFFRAPQNASAVSGASSENQSSPSSDSSGNSSAPESSGAAGSITTPNFALPAIARALANANPTAAAAVARREHEREVERERVDAERRRVRTLWEGLRNRLNSRGRNDLNTPNATVNSPILSNEPHTIPPPVGGVTAADGTNDSGSTGSGLGNGPHDGAGPGTGGLVSDALFHEIARAFNLGSRSSEGQHQDEQQIEPPTATPHQQGDGVTVIHNSQSTQSSHSNHPEVTPVQSNSPSESTNNQQNQDTAREPTQDSFERFLIDLQADLRIALLRLDSLSAETTRPEDHAATGGEEQPPATQEVIASTPNGVDEGTSSGSPLVATRDDVLVPPPCDATGSALAPAVASSLPAPTSVDSDAKAEEVEAEIPPVESNHPHSYRSDSVPVHQATETANILPPSEVTDTSSGPQTSSVPEPELNPPGNVEGASNADTNTRGISTIGRGGISWWRMYRFPPVRISPPVPQSTPPNAGSEPSGDRDTTPQTPSVDPQTSDIAPQSTLPVADGQTTTAPELQPTASPSSPPASNAPTATENSGSLVVPVIVVGLQSIGLDGRQLDQPSEVNPTNTEENETSGSRTETPDRLRGRSWQSRAARALGRFSGRRGINNVSTESGNEAQENVGRTFYIYVFGGYYPPNHQIVTGSDNLDSFEALWELAELLGQVKPPTVTRDDIERSGLETFKAHQIQLYEAEGKIASNCVEKCLVCLDDYAADDDLRLMSCKHAFHKQCVDKWLETGRNNCPACRSTGVNIGEPPVTSS